MTTDSTQFSFVHITDMDNTMVPPGHEGGEDSILGMAEFAEDGPAFAAYSRHCDELGIAFIPSSGRTPASVLKTIGICELPVPPFIIGNVGTQIMTVVTDADGGCKLEPSSQWEEHIGVDWDRQTVADVLACFVAERQGAGFDERNEMQPADRQSEFKQSAWLYDMTADDIAALEQALNDAGMDAQVVYSSNRDLDILPIRAGKGNAAAFVADVLIPVSPEQVIVSGDSGNDFGLFEVAAREGWNAVLPENAHADLVKNVDALGDFSLLKATAKRLGGVMQGIQQFFSAGSAAAAKAASM